MKLRTFITYKDRQNEVYKDYLNEEVEILYRMNYLTVLKAGYIVIIFDELNRSIEDSNIVYDDFNFCSFLSESDDFLKRYLLLSFKTTFLVVDIHNQSFTV